MKLAGRHELIQKSHGGTLRYPVFVAILKPVKNERTAGNMENRAGGGGGGLGWWKKV